MKCPKCGFEGELVNGTCPNCKALISISFGAFSQNPSPQSDSPNQSAPLNMENSNGDMNKLENSNASELLETDNSMENPHQDDTIINNSSNVNNINPDNNESLLKKDLSKVYYIILAVVFVIFLILMAFILAPYFNKGKTSPIDTPKTTEKTEPKVTVISKNIGISTGINFPTYYGNTTICGLRDDKNNKITNADVQILRHLDDDEINSILATHNENLNSGFKWDGVLYKVTLNDFDYLGDETINPVMKTHLFDQYYKNNFFVVNENYYTISPIYESANAIKNGESANVRVVYQVPIDQNYYVCFGEDFSNLGCFINS